MTIHSRLYHGRIRHRRFEPKGHELEYSIFMLFVDLDQLAFLFNGARFWSWNKSNIAALHDQDYAAVLDRPNGTKIDSHLSLKQRVLSLVSEHAVVDDRFRVMMLTHGRYLGHCFNPVTFYYVYDLEDKLIAIVSDITNTPWNERHAYVHLIGQQKQDMSYVQNPGGSHRFEFDKTFHVSPFNPMDMAYEWHFAAPDSKLAVQMNVSVDGVKHFDATLSMEALDWTTANLNKMLRSFPLMTFKVVAGIYWHAFRLWVKRVPFHDNPSSVSQERSGKGSLS